MAKQIQSSSGIVKQSPTQFLTPNQERTVLISEYLYKFAMISNREMPKDGELTKIFVEALDDLSLKEIERGLKAYMKEGDRFPWPSQVRELSEL